MSAARSTALRIKLLIWITRWKSAQQLCCTTGKRCFFLLEMHVMTWILSLQVMFSLVNFYLGFQMKSSKAQEGGNISGFFSLTFCTEFWWWCKLQFKDFLCHGKHKGSTNCYHTKKPNEQYLAVVLKRHGVIPIHAFRFSLFPLHF